MRAQVYRQDYASELFFKSHPDPAGNLCSPVATVFQSASFISSLEELALQAEVVRARQLLVPAHSAESRCADTYIPGLASRVTPYAS